MISSELYTRWLCLHLGVQDVGSYYSTEVKTHVSEWMCKFYFQKNMLQNLLQNKRACQTLAINTTTNETQQRMGRLYKEMPLSLWIYGPAREFLSSPG